MNNLVPRPIVILCCLTPTLASEAFAADATLPEIHSAVFQTHCFGCHDSATKEGNVDLEALSLTISRNNPTAELWQKVLDVVNSDEMPPATEERIPDSDKSAFLRDLSVEMVTARDILSDSGGVIPMRRLNRREYQKTLESLLGFRPDVSELPSDDGVGEFDTFGGSLFFSSDQFEQYRAVATKSLRLALMPQEKPMTCRHRIEPEETISKGFVDQLELSLASRKKADAFLALPVSEQTEKVAKTFGLKDIEHANRIVTRSPRTQRELTNYVSRPESKTGAILAHQGNKSPGISSPKFGPSDAGKYVIRVRAGTYEGCTERERYLEYGFSRGKQSYQVFGHIKVAGTIDEPVTLEIPVEMPMGDAGKFVVKQRDYEEKASRRAVNIFAQRKNGIGLMPSLWIDYVEFEGPFHNTWPHPVQAKLLPDRNEDEHEDEATYARRVITQFATRAFREKSPAASFVDKLVTRHQAKRRSGETELACFVDSFALILSSPHFVYVNEPAIDSDENVVAGERRRLTDLQLAVRLSYFLWSTPPDDELLALANSETLADSGVLAEQVNRLLEDPRSATFVSSFVHQWLDMKRLDMFDFNAAYHPDFDGAIRRNARREIYETFGHMIENDLPLSTLLKADFVVINDVLGDYYGLPDVRGAEFRKVMVPAESPRGGLLGTAAIHIMGSDGQRSSPVERGAWVLRKLLHDPPPPAPANVPMLSRLSDKYVAVRELQKTHQEEPQCAQCHQRIDPIGYGLENFNAAGLWRTMEGVPANSFDKQTVQEPTYVTFPIDPSGTLPSGESFGDYFQLRDAIAHDPAPLARGFTEHLIAYGLGRPFGISDHNLSEQITSQAESNGQTIASFTHAFVQSKTFQSK